MKPIKTLLNNIRKLKTESVAKYNKQVDLSARAFYEGEISAFAKILAEIECMED